MGNRPTHHAKRGQSQRSNNVETDFGGGSMGQSPESRRLSAMGGEDAADLDVEILREMRATFDSFDLDKDGSLTVSELVRVLGALPVEPPFGQKDVEQIVRVLDRNANGMIEFGEFVAYMKKFWFAGEGNTGSPPASSTSTSGGSNSKAGAENSFMHGDLINADEVDAMPTVDYDTIFRIFDLNSDGNISPEELRQVMRSQLGEPVSDDDLAAMFKAADFDGNGLVDPKEFRQLFANVRCLQVGKVV